MNQEPRPLLDGDCDVAAIVQRRAEEPDRILGEFVVDLCEEGYDAVGLLQRRRPRVDLQRGRLDFFLVPDHRDFRSAARPDFLTCAEELRRRVSRRPDFVALNRFGRMEEGGAGLLGVLSDAVRSDIPVAVAVSQGLFDSSVGVADGLAVRLRCEPASLERWWRSLSRATRLRRARDVLRTLQVRALLSLFESRRAAPARAV